MKKLRMLVLLLGCTLLLDSCFLFRPKNRCDTCPHLNKKKKRHGSF
jgi:hypothetical protein